MARLPKVSDLGAQSIPGRSAPVGIPEGPNVGLVAAEGLSQIAETMQKVKEYDDKLAAEDAQNKLQQKMIDLKSGDNGFTQIKSGGVVERPVYKEYMESFDGSVDDISNGLRNDVQREMFKRRAEVLKLQYGNDLTVHIQTEKDAHFNQTIEGGKAIELQDSGEHWDEPGSIAKSVRRTEYLIDLEADRKGLPFAARKAMKTEATSNIHLNVIQQAVSKENPEYAKAYFEKNKKAIDSTKYDEVTELIRQSELNVLSQTVSDDIMARKVDESAALEEVRKKYKGDEEKAIVDAVKSRFKEKRAVETATENEFTDQAWQIYNDAIDSGHPDPYNAIPLDVKNGMNQKSRAVLRKEAKGGKLPNGGVDFYKLKIMARDEPEKFVKENILNYNLSPTDRVKLIELQTKPQELNFFKTEGQIVDAGLRAMNIDPKDKVEDNDDGKRARSFENWVMQQQEDYQRIHNKPMDDKALREVVDRGTLMMLRKAKPLFGEVVHDWTNPDFLPEWMTEPMGGSETPAFEAEVEGIPKEYLPEILEAIKNAGKPVTEENVKKLYYGK